jgi:hypothetical protein
MNDNDVKRSIVDRRSSQLFPQKIKCRRTQLRQQGFRAMIYLDISRLNTRTCTIQVVYRYVINRFNRQLWLRYVSWWELLRASRASNTSVQKICGTEKLQELA